MARGRWNQTGPATAIGLIAPVCWGMSVSLVRGIAENFGMAQGQFFLYLIAAVSLYFTVGLPNFRTMNRKYLFIGIPTAVASGLTFVLAIFTSDGGAQTLEVGMVNYLWPSLTILFAVLFNGVKGRWWLWLGVALALYGLLRMLGGDAGLSWSGFCERFARAVFFYSPVIECAEVVYAVISKAVVVFLPAAPERCFSTLSVCDVVGYYIFAVFPVFYVAD